MTPPVPIVAPELIDATWMTQALRGSGIDASVRELSMRSVGTGQLGETRRFDLRYAGTPPPGAPVSLVGKFPSADPVSAETGRNLGIYRTEVMFYRELAPRTRIRTPRALVAEIDESDRFVLLFEDLAPATQGDQMRGCSLDEARRVLREGALLHSAFWNDQALLKLPWVQVPAGAQGFYTTDLIERSWHHVQHHYADFLTAEMREVCDRYVRHHAYWNRPRDLPKCFSHNDFRQDNMMFGGADGRVAVVDWQTASFLGAGMDVAYFLGGAFDRPTRRQHERALLGEYHEALIAHGVRDYPFDRLLRDYAHYSFAIIAVALAATLIVKRTERGDRMLMQMVMSGAAQVLDNHALDDLPP